jgi:hypothetical protein
MKFVEQEKQTAILWPQPINGLIIQEEIVMACPKAQIDKVSSYDKGAEFLKSKTYDIVILDIMESEALIF